MSASATTATTPSRAHMRWRSAREFWRKFSKRRPGVAGVIVLIVFSILAIAPALFVGPLQTVIPPTGAGFLVLDSSRFAQATHIIRAAAAGSLLAAGSCRACLGRSLLVRATCARWAPRRPASAP